MGGHADRDVLLLFRSVSFFALENYSTSSCSDCQREQKAQEKQMKGKKLGHKKNNTHLGQASGSVSRERREKANKSSHDRMLRLSIE